MVSEPPQVVANTAHGKRVYVMLNIDESKFECVDGNLIQIRKNSSGEEYAVILVPMSKDYAKKTKAFEKDGKSIPETTYYGTASKKYATKFAGNTLSMTLAIKQVSDTPAPEPAKSGFKF